MIYCCGVYRSLRVRLWQFEEGRVYRNDVSECRVLENANKFTECYNRNSGSSQSARRKVCVQYWCINKP